jgi:hypothetical protein
VPAAAPAADGPLGPVAGYAAGPPIQGDGWTRRNYARGGATVEVTVAEQPMTAAQYEEWERQARGYPAAKLGPDASGFFTCADGGPPRCDLHVQTRAGKHLELQAAGRSTRADLEQLYAALGLK